MTNKASSIPALLALALLAGGCTDEATDPAIEVRTTGGGWGCGGCTFNSPRVNDFLVAELSRDFLYNMDDVKLMGIISPTNLKLRLDLIGDELYAKGAGGQVVASGAGLVGWRIWLQTATKQKLYIHIRGYAAAVSEYTNYPLSVSTYAMAYEDPNTPGRFYNICPEAHYYPDTVAVTAIGGETYDPELKVVHENQQGWFTLACSQEAVYKMKLLGYSPNIPFADGPDPSTWEQRQATLKMITADYCGTGVTHTEQGTAIVWNNAIGSVGGPPAAVLPMEARWDENGALCRTAQRFPAIPEECDPDLPLCDDLAAGTEYEWTTWVP